ncbi:hypothetical protein ACIGO9_29770 [Nocardia asteroides]|uniref:hypothetical protein n=1 Tax=Nocardia asteroides TaxID=1824 RepID=UPI0037C87295
MSDLLKPLVPESIRSSVGAVPGAPLPVAAASWPGPGMVHVRVHGLGAEPVIVEAQRVSRCFAVLPLLITDAAGVVVVGDLPAVLTGICSGQAITYQQRGDWRQVAAQLERLPIDWTVTDPEFSDAEVDQVHAVLAAAPVPA